MKEKGRAFQRIADLGDKALVSKYFVEGVKSNDYKLRFTRGPYLVELSYSVGQLAPNQDYEFASDAQMLEIAQLVDANLQRFIEKATAANP